MSEAIIVREWRATTWRPSRTVVAAVLIGAAVLALAAALFGTLRPVPTGDTTVPTNPAIEAKWGIRPIQIAMTADGGLVDFRFIVLDADKAANLMSDFANLPVLRTEDTGIIVSSTQTMIEHSFDVGRTAFLLYRNPGGAVRPGTPVTILFGDLKIEHVIAR
jgi:hypothetical protein